MPDNLIGVLHFPKCPHCGSRMYLPPILQKGDSLVCHRCKKENIVEEPSSPRMGDGKAHLKKGKEKQ